jgi:hypothetical protein
MDRRKSIEIVLYVLARRWKTKGRAEDHGIKGSRIGQ